MGNAMKSSRPSLAIVVEATVAGKTEWRRQTRQQPVRQVGNRNGQESGQQENVMQFAITAIAVLAGMVFSLAIALLVEEFIFGEVFRLMYLPQARVKLEQKQ